MISYLHKLLPAIHEILKESSPPHLMPQTHVGILLFWSDTEPSIATAPQHMWRHLLVHVCSCII